MPLFVCDKCGCIDNTALGGTYWIRNNIENYYDNVKNGEALCIECTPKVYKDGSVNKCAGVWHNKFPKRKFTEDYRHKVLNPPPRGGKK